MKYIISLALFLATQTALADQPTPQNKIKVGVVADLTGATSASGHDLRDTILFANQKIGEGKYDLIFEDEKCNAKDAVTAAHKLTNIDKVAVVLGFSCSGSIIASNSIYKKAGIPVIVASASSPQVPLLGDNLFHLSVNDKYAGSVLGNYISKQSEKKVAIISAQTEYCQDLKKQVFDNIDQQLHQIITEDYAPEENDFKPHLLRLKNSGAEALFINTQAERGAALIYKQLKELKWQPKLYSAYYPGGTTLQKLLGDDLNGTEYVDTVSLHDVLDTNGKQLFEEFKKTYGNLRSYELIFATTYEAFNAMHQAVLSGEPIKMFLEKATIPGIFGKYSFVNHSVTGLNFEMKRISNGKVERILQ